MLNLIVKKKSGSSNRKVRSRFTGVVATTDPVTKDGRTFQFTPEQLKEVANSFVEKPLTHKHRGRTIGKVNKCWYDNGKLHVSGVIFEPRNEDEKKAIEQLENGEVKGLSPSFSFKPEQVSHKVVFHGNLEVIEEKKDGTLIVRGVIPKEELEKKIGSIKNLSKYTITKSWIHDGKQETKKKIETDE